jgi:hypothetical protein
VASLPGRHQSIIAVNSAAVPIPTSTCSIARTRPVSSTGGAAPEPAGCVAASAAYVATASTCPEPNASSAPRRESRETPHPPSSAPVSPATEPTVP